MTAEKKEEEGRGERRKERRAKGSRVPISVNSRIV